jgi:hypothetical protein
LKIQIDPHTLERAQERGTNDSEIREVIQTGSSIPAKHNRIGKVKIFGFNQFRKGKYYEQKRVEVFYVIENNIIITVTVYVFFGKWE